MENLGTIIARYSTLYQFDRNDESIIKKDIVNTYFKIMKICGYFHKEGKYYNNNTYF